MKKIYYTTRPHPPRLAAQFSPPPSDFRGRLAIRIWGTAGSSSGAWARHARVSPPLLCLDPPHAPKSVWISAAAAQELHLVGLESGRHSYGVRCASQTRGVRSDNRRCGWVGGRPLLWRGRRAAWCARPSAAPASMAAWPSAAELRRPLTRFTAWRSGASKAQPSPLPIMEWCGLGRNSSPRLVIFRPIIRIFLYRPILELAKRTTGQVNKRPRGPRPLTLSRKGSKEFDQSLAGSASPLRVPC